jgi:predicted MFS family arabinose efflux permease
LIQHAGYEASFRGLAGIAVLAFAILALAVPETLVTSREQLRTPEPAYASPERTLPSLQDRAKI